MAKRKTSAAKRMIVDPKKTKSARKRKININTGKKLPKSTFNV